MLRALRRWRKRRRLYLEAERLEADALLRWEVAEDNAYLVEAVEGVLAAALRVDRCEVRLAAEWEERTAAMWQRAQALRTEATKL